MDPAFFKAALFASLALCGLGVAWRVSGWFRLRVGQDVRDVSVLRRLGVAALGAARALASRRAPGLVRALVWDVLLQGRLFRIARWRWAGHLMVVVGFGAVLVLHGLSAVVTRKLFPGFEPTLDPWLFLRNLFGALVVVGVVIVRLGRRRGRASLPRGRAPGDGAFVALLGVAFVAGFLLEAHKLASPATFYRMAEEYAGTRDPDELAPLRAAWASDYGTAFHDIPDPPDPEALKAGREMHAEGCAPCHAAAKGAFVSYPVARALRPIAATLDAGNADVWLYRIHVLACLLGLAVLPFTRLFHAVADPASLLARAGAGEGRAASLAGRATRRALAPDACVRCGLCDARCSVGPVARALPNPEALPSHKLVASRAVARGRVARRGGGRARALAEGAYACTECGRCTDACPVGLDLDDLWEAGRSDLAAAGQPAPAGWVGARSALEWEEALVARAGSVAAKPPAWRAGPLSGDRGTFSRCVQCQTCTNVCPVVAAGMVGDGPDLTPQKVMNLLRLGLEDLAIGSGMVWRCATCYQCQEHCPEGIRVTDVMLELRGLGYRRLGSARDGGGKA